MSSSRPRSARSRGQENVSPPRLDGDAELGAELGAPASASAFVSAEMTRRRGGSSASRRATAVPTRPAPPSRRTVESRSSIGLSAPAMSASMISRSVTSATRRARRELAQRDWAEARADERSTPSPSASHSRRTSRFRPSAMTTRRSDRPRPSEVASMSRSSTGRPPAHAAPRHAHRGLRVAAHGRDVLALDLAARMRERVRRRRRPWSAAARLRSGSRGGRRTSGRAPPARDRTPSSPLADRRAS